MYFLDQVYDIFINFFEDSSVEKFNFGTSLIIQHYKCYYLIINLQTYNSNVHKFILCESKISSQLVKSLKIVIDIIKKKIDDEDDAIEQTRLDKIKKIVCFLILVNRVPYPKPINYPSCLLL
jgi:hypothetical protein